MYYVYNPGVTTQFSFLCMYTVFKMVLIGLCIYILIHPREGDQL